jgi:class 3 adenylate cyclase
MSPPGRVLDRPAPPGYPGLEVHRAARVGSAAQGRQLLMTGVVAELLREVVPSQPLRAHRSKDFPTPTALYCAVIDGQGAGAFPGSTVGTPRSC